MKKKEKLFVYGTLKDARVQRNVFFREIKDGVPTTIHGYKIEELTLGGVIYPALVPHKKGIVEGILLTITPLELKLIDHYETSAYKRESILLDNDIHCWVYLKN